jgi:hypothetical protein
MMTPFSILDLLAARDDSDNPVKLIFGVIVVVIWIIGAVMSSLKKKSQQPTQQFVQQDWSHLLRDLTAGQNKPFNPTTPAPPQVMPPPAPRPQHMQYPQVHAFTQQAPPQQKTQPPRQQIKSFAQQSPRPFVQQYRQQIPQRTPPAPRRVMQTPKPIQKRPKPQHRPPALPAHAPSAPRVPQAQIGLVPDDTVTRGQAGGATNINASTTRTGGSGPLTRGQLRKLILWSEVLSPPLSIREY